MQTLWFGLVGFMLAMYVVLDGFDLGAGAIHLFVAKNERERRAVLRAIGPVWDGNEVWLIAAGGTLFFTFPKLYAAAFSGFYLPLIIVLWLLIGRGLAIELRGHVASLLWGTFWDGAFFLASALLALFFGAALANVVRGVALDQSGYFFAPLWTNFDPRAATPGILDGYTVTIAALALAALVMHGAHWIAVKTEGALAARAWQIARGAWLATLLLTAGGTVWTFALRPVMWQRFAAQPWGFVFPLLALGGLAAAGHFERTQRDMPAFLASAAYLVGMLASTAFALYPRMLPAVNDAYSLTTANTASPAYGLAVGLVWWGIGMALAAVYFVLIYNLFRGKVRLTDEGY